MPVVLGSIMRTKPKTLGEYIVELQTRESVLSADVGLLIDAWRLRFGTRWVTTEETESDAFFKEVTARLASTPYLEWHITVGTGATPICRLIERW